MNLVAFSFVRLPLQRVGNIIDTLNRLPLIRICYTNHQSFFNFSMFFFSPLLSVKQLFLYSFHGRNVLPINHLSSDVTRYMLYFEYEILGQVSEFYFGCPVFCLLYMKHWTENFLYKVQSNKYSCALSDKIRREAEMKL